MKNKDRDNSNILSNRDLEGVNKYREQSEVFKNYQKAVESTVGRDKIFAKRRLHKLENATSLSQMLQIADKYAIDNEPYLRQIGVKLACSVGGYFSTSANFSHYSMQLKSDIIAFAAKNDYPIEDEAENEKRALIS